NNCSKGIDVLKELDRIKREANSFSIEVNIKFKESKIDLRRRYYLLKEVKLAEFYKVEKSPPKKRKVLGNRVKYYKRIDSNKCVFCEICANICPNGALISDGNGKIYFEYLNCTGCELCIYSCPTKAIQPSTGFDKNPLVTLPIKRCSSCGNKFHGSGDKCPKCVREEEELKSIFRSLL
ncbi:MAG: 4Fe-4S binding protein, partial [Sulfolobales archaeon]